MRKIYLLLLVNVCTLAVIAQSPITLGNSNMPGSGDTLRYTNFMAGSAGNYTQTGANFNWDFNQVVSTSEGLRSFRNALQTPYALFFLSLNEYGEKIADTLGTGPLTLTKYYNFYKKQASPVNAFIADGVGMTFSNVPVPSYYTDKDELYIFPMTFPKYDSTSFRFSTGLGGFIPVTYVKSGYRVTVVDGWGKVTTPYGTENCLRLVTTQYAMDSIKNSILPIPLGFPNYQRSYQWLTLTSRIPYLEITGSLAAGIFTPLQTRYRGYAREQVTVGLSNKDDLTNEILLYPNPVKNILNLNNAGSEEMQYEVYGVDGKYLRSFNTQFAGGSVSLDMSGLEAGIYLLKMSNGEQQHVLKFIKE